jgi:chromosomal replication initiation ATPase DnaA
METLEKKHTGINYMTVPGIKESSPDPITLIDAVCETFGLEVFVGQDPADVLFARTRKREVINARQAYIYLLMTTRIKEVKIFGGQMTIETLPLGLRSSCSAVARFIGHGFDHATIYHSKKVAQNHFDTERDFRDKVKSLQTDLKDLKIIMPIL